MTLAAGVAAALEQACRSPVAHARRVGGGDINEAYALVLRDGRRVFVKTRPDAAAGEYAAEAAGLEWLREPRGLALPAVLAVGDGEGGVAAGVGGAGGGGVAAGVGGAGAGDPGGAARFLALEWVDAGVLDRAGEERLGRGLAAVHAAGAPAFGASAPASPTPGGGQPGSPTPGGDPPPLRIGALVLPNAACASWGEFYAQRRLLPLVELALRGGSLSREGGRAVVAVCERIGELAGPAEPPARLHGDLWTGNVLAGADGRPWLIDPAAYGGHRELDLAMLRLFGARSSVDRVVAAYGEVSPLADGHERRVALWQLFPLLVHAVLFGGAYGTSVVQAARSCLAG